MRRKRFGRSRFKRSNVTRRGFRNTGVLSGQLGNTLNNNYSNKKLSRQRYRAQLLNSTLFKPHYRSVFTVSAVATTPIGTSTATKIALVPILNLAGSANPFWTVAGGTQAIDTGVAVPTFNSSSMILRGGRSSMSIGNNSLVDAVRLRCWLLKTRPNSSGTHGTFNAITTVPTQWDPTVFPDFHESFKIVQFFEHILLPGSRPFELYRHLKVQKIDFDEWTNNENTYVWVFTIAQMTDIDTPATSSVTYVNSYNLAFSGDIV